MRFAHDCGGGWVQSGTSVGQRRDCLTGDRRRVLAYSFTDSSNTRPGSIPLKPALVICRLYSQM